MPKKTREPNEASRAMSDTIRAERHARRLTMDDVWHAAGLTRSHYAKIERGEVVVDYDEIAAIAAVFHLTSSELARRADQRLMDGLNLTDAERADLERARASRRQVPRSGHGDNKGRSADSG